MNIWFTGDWHISHANIIKYCNRPFSNVEEMDNTILNNFFSVVKTGDVLYFLGDLTFDNKKAEEILKKFFNVGIKLFYIEGNHDRNVIRALYDLNIKHYTLLDTNINGFPVSLCHYAMRVWNKSHFNSWNLYGHSHNTLEGIGKQMDVGVDTNNFFPYNFFDIKNIMEKKEDNFNYINET